MAAKRIDPLKAKEAKQKKIAIGGAVLLLALLGVQGPKTLKMLKGQQAAAPAAVESPAATPETSVPVVGSDAASLPVAATGTELSAVADSDAAPAAVQGQLATFERFASKDPFAQQAEPVAAPAPKAAPKDDADKAPVDKAGEGKSPATAGDADAGTDGGFTTGGSTGADTPKLASATSISVNGVAEDVELEAVFPKDEPTFVLVSIAKDGKSVEIGIAGGEYATGGETMKLALGKKMTLQNTADGSRYELELLTIQGVAVPKPKK